MNEPWRTSYDYLKLKEAPMWHMSYPTCGACGVDLFYDDGWMCEVCGTQWPSNANDGDIGELYEVWSGEALEGEAVSGDIAWEVTDLTGEERQRKAEELSVKWERLLEEARAKLEARRQAGAA